MVQWDVFQLALMSWEARGHHFDVAILLMVFAMAWLFVARMVNRLYVIDGDEANINGDGDPERAAAEWYVVRIAAAVVWALCLICIRSLFYHALTHCSLNTLERRLLAPDCCREFTLCVARTKPA